MMTSDERVLTRDDYIEIYLEVMKLGPHLCPKKFYRTCGEIEPPITQDALRAMKSMMFTVKIPRLRWMATECYGTRYFVNMLRLQKLQGDEGPETATNYFDGWKFVSGEDPYLICMLGRMNSALLDSTLKHWVVFRQVDVQSITLE
jgi:hypothetical protein